MYIKLKILSGKIFLYIKNKRSHLVKWLVHTLSSKVSNPYFLKEQNLIQPTFLMVEFVHVIDALTVGPNTINDNITINQTLNITDKQKQK